MLVFLKIRLVKDNDLLMSKMNISYNILDIRSVISNHSRLS